MRSEVRHGENWHLCEGLTTLAEAQGSCTEATARQAMLDRVLLLLDARYGIPSKYVSANTRNPRHVDRNEGGGECDAISGCMFKPLMSGATTASHNLLALRWCPVQTFRLRKRERDQVNGVRPLDRRLADASFGDETLKVRLLERALSLAEGHFPSEHHHSPQPAPCTVLRAGESEFALDLEFCTCSDTMRPSSIEMH